VRSATHTPGADSDYIPSRSVYAATHPHLNQLAGLHAMGMMHHHTRSAAFDFKPAYDRRDLSAQYYDAHLRFPQQRYLHHGVVEDVLVDRTPSPSLAFPQSNVALHPQYDPLSQYHHVKVEQQAPSQSQQQHHHHHQQHQPHHHVEHRIDPSLMGHDNGLFETGGYGSMPGMLDSGLGGAGAGAGGDGAVDSHFAAHGFMGLDETLSLEQHAQFLRGAPDEWQIEPLPETAHFDTSWVEPKAEP
jgi:hypothetical protein